MSFVVRAALPADRAACARLWATGQKEIEPGARLPWLPSAFDEAVRGEEIVVAADADGQIVAFLSLWRPDRFVHFLHVRHDRRRLGLARLLLEAARASVDGPLELKCLPGNAPALACYRALGWQEVERRSVGPVPFIRFRQPV